MNLEAEINSIRNEIELIRRDMPHPPTRFAVPAPTSGVSRVIIVPNTDASSLTPQSRQVLVREITAPNPFDGDFTVGDELTLECWHPLINADYIGFWYKEDVSTGGTITDCFPLPVFEVNGVKMVYHQGLFLPRGATADALIAEFGQTSCYPVPNVDPPDGG